MASDDKDADNEAPEAAAEPSGIKKWLPLTLGMFLIVMVSQVVAPIISRPIMDKLYPTQTATDDAEAAEGEEQEDEEPAAPPIYWPLNPPMVVNLNDDAGTFLQISLEVMAREQDTIEAVKTHNAAIRNALLMNFSSQKSEDISSREGRERLRIEALEEVRQVLADYVPEEQNVEEVFFTSFVAQ